MNGSHRRPGLALTALLALMALAAACTPAAAPATQPAAASPVPEPTAVDAAGGGAAFDGRWEGELEVAGQKLVLQLDIEGQGGTVTLPQQTSTGIRMEKFSTQGSAIHFEMLPAPRSAVFDGTLAGEKISGSFEQSGYKGSFSVTRVEVAPVAAEPKAYLEEDVTFKNGAYTLAGTLTLPVSGGPHPAVVLISGSGAQNRDEELFGFKPFAILADHLTLSGIAVLRYDDRGIGGSTTGTMDDTSETFAADVAAALDYLQTRGEIDSSKIGLLGHSEGGIIAPMVAAAREDIAFVVLMAGPGVSGQELLPEQVRAIALASGASEAKAAENAAEEERVLEAIVTGEGLDEVKAEMIVLFKAAAEQMPEDQRKALGDVDKWASESVNGQLAMMASPWFTFFLTHDPAPVLAELDAPVLALLGGKDAQVPAELNRSAIAAALEKGGAAKSTVKVFPEANHLFQAARTGSPQEYATLKPEFLPGFLDTISEWILAQVG